MSQNLCLDKAQESGIGAAQLPIGRYLSHLPTRKVLTVNQVFEILVKWVETRDWELSLYAVIPKRKFQDSDCFSLQDIFETCFARTPLQWLRLLWHGPPPNLHSHNDLERSQHGAVTVFLSMELWAPA
ncbi:hypothetical protein BJV78DRAFT_1290336 [Lactifluus subvellereus]|nr:hypothetical protein BJV78DRAFT_1290336 [Lactifluus subvellereus]